ncbi:amino-acid N-acetyltransferase [Pseudomonas sp. G11-1]|uniref:Amino-acid acetyltransferase n=1 Tax=Halopseudomonas bauzanensis TaxID=653930 RepID=A0A031MI57_9GAMM|nr:MULTISPECIES: amino-acid N-acetyltransferase [Halopseudomonas]MCO5785559.1 amino-acid N-acetyltransferase [Pseudomonas sp. G11-1]MCO5788337.1 amino-acid N-acetyltransferase [Pseudomonas sp. G11-2]EZQ19670.1 N-acetylglutamate synthase [Halopseudomonas bauzanensis]TKA93370.1 amino-acid N-acetyltransferase [Halopseudomonas bauzanensis]WGK61159.1 amino-acid N-acetyltransferase [Halopseudomonas sp. SMJS2]
MSDYVKWFRHSTPYINTHRDRTFVVLLPGEAIAHPNFNNIVNDIMLLNSLGVRLVLVHGSRPQIEDRLGARGLSSRYHQDLRITDSDTLGCVMDAVGSLRIAIEARLCTLAGQGSRLRVVSGNFVTAKPIGVIDGVDLHHTGEVRRIDRKAISRHLDDESIVLLSSIGYSPTGEVFNLACEDVATSAASALEADKLILFGPDTGIFDAEGRLLRELKPSRAQSLLAALGNSLPGSLLTAACKACNAGLRRSHIISYAEDGAMLTELFTRDGGGTLVTQEPFEKIRTATIEDVAGLLELLHPLEEAGVLVRRSREVLETEINQFTLVERDGTIIGCAALYPLDEHSAELACVAIHPDYRHGGRGDQLLEHIETQARARSLTTLFVLTTRTAHWFRERGFEPSSVARLPQQRASLYNYQRNSKVFEKSL